MEKEFKIGDIISIADISETHDFKVTRLTSTMAVAEEIPITLFPGFQTTPIMKPIKVKRKYTEEKLSETFYVWKIDFIPKLGDRFRYKISIRTES